MIKKINGKLSCTNCGMTFKDQDIKIDDTKAQFGFKQPIIEYNTIMRAIHHQCAKN